MKDLDSLKKNLAQVAEIVNAFKSESVQLRVLDYILETKIDNTSEAGELLGTKRKRGKKQTKNKTSKKEDGKNKAGRSAKKSRPFATAILDELLQSGFFDKKRTIADIISYTGPKMGHHYKTSEISTPLIRFVRDGKLNRDKNAENQFEYLKK